MSSVEVTGSKILIRELMLDDQEAVQILSDYPEPERPEVAKQALRLGLILRRQASTAINVDFVKREFGALKTTIDDYWKQEVVTKIDNTITNYFDLQKGTVPRLMAEYLGDPKDGRVKGKLDQLFDEKNTASITFQLRQLVRDELTGENSKFLAALDLENKEKPLGQLWGKIDGELSKLRDLLVGKQATELEREKGALKGRDYQSLVLEAVSEIARHYGDTPEGKFDEPGLGGSKVGDIVVTINSRDTQGVPVRLVFEAKDKATGLTPMLRELDEAQVNRSAAAGIAVYSREAYMPTGASPLLDQGTNQYLCLYSKDSVDSLALKLAYRLARFWVIADLGPKGDEVDIHGIREDIKKAQIRLKTLSSLKGKLTSMNKQIGQSIEGIQNEIAEMEQDINEIFGRIDEYLKPGGKPASS